MSISHFKFMGKGRSIQAPGAVVMIRPHNFWLSPASEVNKSLQQNGSTLTTESLAQAALEEFNVAAMSLIAAGVEVHVFDDKGERETPDSVFPSHWLSTHNGGHVAIYPMASKVRRRERRADIVDLLKERFRVQDVMDYSALEHEGIYLEGTGVMVLDHLDRVVYAAHSERASPVALERFCSRFNFEPVGFDASRLNGRVRFQTNLMMCIATDFSLVGLTMITDPIRREEVRERMMASGREVIEIDESQVNNFVGNAMELSTGDGRILAISERAVAALTHDQIRMIEAYANIVPLRLPTIEMAGCSVRCMLAGVHLTRR